MQTKLAQINGKKISIRLETDADESVFYEIFTNRDYRILDEDIKKATGCIIDIGGHKGMFALYARCLNEGVPIFIFEPDEENFSELKNNIKENHAKNIHPKNLAIAGRNEERTFYISADSHRHSLLQDIEHTYEKRLTTVTLENILSRIEKEGRAKIDLLKMDAEGAEFEILENTAPETLKKIRTIYLEYHQYSPELTPDRLKRILEKSGFKVRITPSHYDKKMGFIYAKQ